MIGVDDLKWWGLELSKILTIRKAFFLLHMVVFSRIRLGFIFARWRSETLPLFLFLIRIISGFKKLLTKHFRLQRKFQFQFRLGRYLRYVSNASGEIRPTTTKDDTSVAAPQCCRTLRHTIVPSSITQLHIEKCHGNSASSSSSFLVVVFCV